MRHFVFPLLIFLILVGLLAVGPLLKELNGA